MFMGDCGRSLSKMKKEDIMAKNRIKQRAHLNCGMSKEERLKAEARQANKEEKLDLIDYCGIKDPTPYEAVRNIIRKERAVVRKQATRKQAVQSATA